MNKKRLCFLLLQGPTSPFFRRLGRRLLREGHEVITVSVSLGDALFNLSGEAVRYKGSFADWGEFLAELQRKRGITDVVMYNDCRPYHAEALKALRPLGVRSHIFEEGYFRPNRITYEQGGINGYSAFCGEEKAFSDPEDHAYDMAEPHIPLPPALRNIYAYTFFYYLISGSLNPIFFPLYRFHRERHPGRELFSRIRRAALYWPEKWKSDRRQKILLNSGRPYFLLLLQLSADSQIRRHSPFKKGGMRELIDYTVSRFSQDAPEDTLLVIKNHPLDNGTERLEAFTAACAEGYGVADRVVFIDKGHLPALVKNSQGALTANSTAGASVLHHGKPLLCFGKAIYIHEGLAKRHVPGDDTLTRFWHNPEPPDHIAYQRFRYAVHARTQIYGNFYTVEGVRCALRTLFRYAPFSSDPVAKQITDSSICLCSPYEH